MIIPTYEAIRGMIESPVRQIKARVELLEGSTLLNTFTCEDRLISFDVQRVGEGRFFGFGICARLNVKLIDTKRELNITTANTLEIVFGCEENYMYALPLFKVSEVHRDETTNELSITAYDWLYQAAEHTAAEMALPLGYSIGTIADAAAAVLGLNFRFDGLNEDEAFNIYYPTGANIDGTETIRELLDDVAEATQTIYFVNNQWELVFKRLDKDGPALLTIDKDKYFSLSSKTNRRLSCICQTSELGNNVSASIGESGTTAYIRDNAFYDLREDIADLLNDALKRVGGFTINQFEMEWRGNYLLELGDKIALITKDGSTAYSYLLDDTINYNGVFSQSSRWSYSADEAETESNPTSLGDAIKQTFARVDKANRQIDLVASKTEDNAESISSLMINTNNILASVQTISTATNDALVNLNGELSEITNRVNAAMTAEDVKLSIETELLNGVDKVITATGYTFDDEGLTVSKSNSEMKTTISDDGMIVYKNDEAMLTANNIGVNAVNLHANTYLIIGNNSRIEDYDGNRTGVFWIGGV